jgi:hypothetical protein
MSQAFGKNGQVNGKHDETKIPTIAQKARFLSSCKYKTKNEKIITAAT